MSYGDELLFHMKGPVAYWRDGPTGAQADLSCLRISDGDRRASACISSTSRGRPNPCQSCCRMVGRVDRRVPPHHSHADRSGVSAARSGGCVHNRRAFAARLRDFVSRGRSASASPGSATCSNRQKDVLGYENSARKAATGASPSPSASVPPIPTMCSASISTCLAVPREKHRHVGFHRRRGLQGTPRIPAGGTAHSAGEEVVGYQWIQGTKPQTLPMADGSARGLAAWIVEKFRVERLRRWIRERAIPRDAMLANIIYGRRARSTRRSGPITIAGMLWPVARREDQGADTTPHFRTRYWPAALDRRTSLRRAALERDAERRPFRRAPNSPKRWRTRYANSSGCCDNRRMSPSLQAKRSKPGAASRL